MQDKIHKQLLTGVFLFLLVATTLLCFWIGLRPFEPASAASVPTAAIAAQPPTAQAPADLPAPIASLADLIDHERTTRGLAPLQLDSRLSASATTKAQHIVTHDYWAHAAPDGTTPWSFIDQAGYDYTQAGENLGRCFEDNQRLVEEWVASPTHYANIVGDYEDFGFGVAYRDDGCMVVVNHFGRQ